MESIAVVSEGEGLYSEKRSRFLGFAMPCNSEDEAQALIAKKRKKYWDARHAVYAYILPDGTARFSDDGEPHGTAGKPVLDVIKGGGVTGALIVVIRYFGGTLLGTGGLVRAYGAAAAEALDNCGKAKVTDGDEFSLKIGYGDYDKLLFLLKEYGAEIKDTAFEGNIKLSFAVRSDVADACLKKISETFSSLTVPKFEKKTKIFEKI